MAEPTINTAVQGGTVYGVAGAGYVVIENFYAGASAPPTAATQEAEKAGPVPPCPYPGLAYFGPQDSALFFGREKAILALVGTVPRHGLTALVGASGSGKSSVVLAGLAPRLAAGGDWAFSYFRVGTETEKSPFLAVARALVPLLLDGASPVDRLSEIGNLAKRLQSGEITLGNVLGECRRQRGKRILLIADQFEEVFTLIDEEAVRQRFIDVLLSGFASVDAGSSPQACLLLTLRADFYNMVLRSRPLSDAIQGHVENLGPMTRDELREAIERPAGEVVYERGLVDTLLDDVANRPGNLPLLQFALREMWLRQEAGRLTHKAYHDIGRVEGALARRAHEIFDKITKGGDDEATVMLFRRLFTRMVTLGEGAEDTRRVVNRRELGDDAWNLAQRLAGEDNRLVVTGAAAPGSETAEVVHEALIRHWPDLIDWIGKDREFQTWLRQIRPRVDEWLNNPGDEGNVLRGGSLAVAEEWLQSRGDELAAEERDFIYASADARNSEQARSQRLRRRLFIGTGSAAGVFFGAFLVSGWLYFRADAARQEAIRQHSIAYFTSDAMTRISSSASNEAIRLSALAASVVRSSSVVEQVRAYLEFAKHYDDAWDVGRASDALKRANQLIADLQTTASNRKEVSLLEGYAHEIAGDVKWGDSSGTGADFKNSESEYKASLAALVMGDAPMVDRLRVECKIARALMFEGRQENAETELVEAEAGLPANPRSLERALIDDAQADLLLQRSNTDRAAAKFAEAVAILLDLVKTEPANKAVKVQLATELEKSGDLQRHSKNANAMGSYVAAASLFNELAEDNPTSFFAATGLELIRHNIRLLGKTAEADSIENRRTSDLADSVNRDFSAGVGPYRFGMTIQEVNRLLNPPYPEDTLKTLPRAWEYHVTEVRYFWRWLRELPDFNVFVKDSPCLTAESYGLFMFHDERLFRIVFRILSNDKECLARDHFIDDFAGRYGLSAFGSNAERRIRYKNSDIAISGFTGPDTVSLDFIER